MGTTRIKVIDLSGEKEQIKTSRKHAEKLTGVAKIKAAKGKPRLQEREEKKPKQEVSEGPKGSKVSEVEEKEVASVSSEPSAPSQPSQPSKLLRRHHHLGRKYLEAKAIIELQKLYPAGEAIDLLYKTSVTKFDPTVEIHLNVVDKNIKGTVKLPYAIDNKKETRILVFSDQEPALPAGRPESGDQRLIWGDEKTIDEIAEGKLRPNRDFDKVVSAPKFMPALAKIAKILGPQGLMPNPKNGTVNADIAQAVKATGAEGLEYKTDPNAPIVHTRLGKLSFKPQELEQNLKTLVASIGPTKIRKAVITSTMGPGIKVDISTISQ